MFCIFFIFVIKKNISWIVNKIKYVLICWDLKIKFNFRLKLIEVFFEKKIDNMIFFYIRNIKFVFKDFI